MKHKIVIDPRRDYRVGRAKVYSEIVDIADAEVVADLDDAMVEAEWSEDPGTGKAVLLADGRELLNPVPVAPPASIAAYSQEASVNDLVQRALSRHLEMLRGAEDIDSLDEMDDFPEDEEWSPMSMYEAVVLAAEAPAVPEGVQVDEGDLDKLEAEAVAAAPPKKKAPKAPSVEPEEGSE